VLGAVLWTIGAVLLAAGWWGDEAGFWSDKPFLTNVFSSMTAVSFGIPLALIVLQRMGVAQTEAVEARAARRLAVKVAGDLVAAVPRLHPGAASDLLAAKTGLFAAERAAQEAIRRWEDSRDEDSVRELRQLVASGSVAGALASFKAATGAGKQAVPAVADVSAHWSFLNTTVRSRLLETGGTWLAPPLAAQINEIVGLLTADPYLDGWLRDVDMAIRRLRTTPDLSAALRDLWIQLEIGSELADALSRLGDLMAEAASVLGVTVRANHAAKDR
jgi:hypothetical protein